jgi:tetratricopeptide (TPR) repeat protein
LAAVNTIVALRERLSRGVDDEVGVQGTYGSIASEYYSIAKLVPSRHDRRQLLARALKNVSFAIGREQPHPSGLLAIRGSVRLAMGEVRSAVEDYEECLRTRVHRGEDLGRVGEAEVELAMGYLREGRIWKVRGLLEQGVDNLRASDRPAFLVRALRKLSVFYTIILRRRQAGEVFREALDLASRRELEGQVSQIREEMRRFGHWRR